MPSYIKNKYVEIIKKDISIYFFFVSTGQSLDDPPQSIYNLIIYFKDSIPQKNQ